MRAYLAARELAVKTQDWEVAAALEGNIAELYAQMVETEAALRAAESGLALLKDCPTSKYRPKLLIQLGRLRAQTGRLDLALSLFQQAVQEADRQADLVTHAMAWSQLGYELMRLGHLEAAEHALLESFRSRRLNRDPAVLISYRLLGLLRLAQSDLNSASHLLDRAVTLAATSPRLVPFWQLHHDRGRVRMAQGRLVEALEDFRLAVDSARRWRPEVLPADALRVGVDVGLQEVFSSLVEAGNRLYFQTEDPALARETFEVAEENRAYSLRTLVAEPQEWRDRLPAEYGETLVRLRNAEAALLNGDSPSVRRQIRELHRHLAELETRTGLASNGATSGGSPLLGLSELVRARLTPGEALLSFHLGEPHSYLSGITREGLELHRLPPRSRLREQVERFAKAVQHGAKESLGLGATLYQELFGELRVGTRNKPHWLLTLDDVLFELPFAALPDSPAPERTRFLIERHSLEVAPSAYLLVAARARPRSGFPAEGGFLAVGDPVYNAADSRWAGPRPAANKGRKPLELPRLAGSAREVRACARLWSSAGHSAVVLEGHSASGPEVFKRLQSSPAVAHFATHVVASSARRGLIALSLSPGGDAELLTPLQIVHWRRSPSLVVLSGCSSAQGEALPGAGLMGLTRAWLAAGADTVVASRWPTPDDSGEMFLSFYRRLLLPDAGLGPARPAAALREAQLEMLRSGSWRAAPNYWAAFLAVGTE
jgi:CHAT domain-containing protein/tetratricopeptide (TPR) repeat protein